MAFPSDAPGGIRPARPEEADRVRAVVHAAYAPLIAVIGREPGPMGDDYAVLIALGQVHVAADGESLQGVLVLKDEADALLLDNVAVAPDIQARGIGRHLIAFAEEEARRRGYRAITLYTNVLMTRNIALYAKLGYAETHRAVVNGYARVFMRKAL